MQDISLIIEKLKKANFTLSVAESCTGGNIAKMITSVSGSSSYFTGSVVAYSKSVKEDILGVKAETITKYGVVSQEVELDSLSTIDSLTQNTWMFIE